MSEIVSGVILTVILLLSVLSLAALIATPFLSRRVDEKKEQVLVLLLPLEFIIVLFSSPFWCVALMILSGV